jgi:hypothetical protein
MRLTVLFAGAWMLAACGDNENKPDARVADAAEDAPLDAFVECNYNEAHDTTNDYLAASGYMLEQTGITYKKNSTRTVCGTINNGHFDGTQFSVDIDNYGITVAADVDVIVSLTAPGAGALANGFTVGVFSVDHATQKGVGGGNFVGDHAVFSTHLPAGSYEFSVEAYANGDIAASIPYKMRISADNPTTRCPKLTTAANYTEANDGAGNTGNDVIAIDYTANPKITLTAAADAAEPTGLTLAAGTNYRISGTSAAVAKTGSYFDRDSYAVTTGATTNQLAVRLNWATTTADLDYYLFDGTSIVGAAAKMMLGEDEFATFAVEPSKAYTFWVGGFQSSTGLPATYDASLCAEAFTQ